VADQKEPTYDSYTQADAAGTPCVAILATALTRYIKGVANFAKYRQRRPDQLGPDEIRTYEAVRYRRPRCRLRVILRQEEAVRLMRSIQRRLPLCHSESPVFDLHALGGHARCRSYRDGKRNRDRGLPLSPKLPDTPRSVQTSC
jgi:hypothetical protein